MVIDFFLWLTISAAGSSQNFEPQIRPTLEVEAPGGEYRFLSSVATPDSRYAEASLYSGAKIIYMMQIVPPPVQAAFVGGGSVVGYGFAPDAERNAPGDIIVFEIDRNGVVRTLKQMPRVWQSYPGGGRANPTVYGILGMEGLACLRMNGQGIGPERWWLWRALDGHDEIVTVALQQDDGIWPFREVIADPANNIFVARQIAMSKPSTLYAIGDRGMEICGTLVPAEGVLVSTKHGELEYVSDSDCLTIDFRKSKAESGCFSIVARDVPEHRATGSLAQWEPKEIQSKSGPRTGAFVHLDIGGTAWFLEGGLLSSCCGPAAWHGEKDVSAIAPYLKVRDCVVSGNEGCAFLYDLASSRYFRCERGGDWTPIWAQGVKAYKGLIRPDGGLWLATSTGIIGLDATGAEVVRIRAIPAINRWVEVPKVWAVGPGGGLAAVFVDQDRRPFRTPYLCVWDSAGNAELVAEIPIAYPAIRSLALGEHAAIIGVRDGALRFSKEEGDFMRAPMNYDYMQWIVRESHLYAWDALSRRRIAFDF